MSASTVPSPSEPTMVSSSAFGLMLDYNLYASAVLAIVLWDYLITLKDEINMYRLRGMKLIFLPFLVARYGTIAAVVTNLVLLRRGMTLSPDSCFYTGRSIVFLGVIVTAASSSIFVIRTYILWRRAGWVLVTLVLLWCAQLAGTLVVGNWIRPTPVPTVSNICLMLMPNHEVSWVLYMCNMVFDAVVLIFALVALLNPTNLAISSQGTGSGMGLPTPPQKPQGFFARWTAPYRSRVHMHRLQARVMADGIVFFVCAMLMNLINTLFLTVGRTRYYANINTVAATAVTGVCAGRLVLLKLPVDLPGRKPSGNGNFDASHMSGESSFETGSPDAHGFPPVQVETVTVRTTDRDPYRAARRASFTASQRSSGKHMDGRAEWDQADTTSLHSMGEVPSDYPRLKGGFRVPSVTGTRLDFEGRNTGLLSPDGTAGSTTLPISPAVLSPLSPLEEDHPLSAPASGTDNVAPLNGSGTMVPGEAGSEGDVGTINPLTFTPFDFTTSRAPEAAGAASSRPSETLEVLQEASRRW